MRTITEFRVRIVHEHEQDTNFSSWAHHIKQRIEEGKTYGGVDVQFIGNDPFEKVEYPFEITGPQQRMLWKKWAQDGQELTFQEFVDGINKTSNMDGAITVQWCGMWLAIERDGYTHS